VVRSCRDGRRELEDLLLGATPRAEVDDTQMEESSIRSFPPLKGRPVEGSFFRDQRGEPMMILSLHSPSQELQRFFSTPLQHIESYSVGGGSRWTIDTSPVYKVWQDDPDSRRVGWDGWCGHLVRDLSSMGGTKKENTVVCLESPRIQEAVREYIRANIPKFYQNPELLYNIMGYELMYICYCDRSRTAFHTWLEKKHGSIEHANRLWHTSYAGFKEVIPPPVKNSAPLPGTNRAVWYEWARFNQDRFTDYLISVRDTIRRIDPSVPLAAGGSSSMLAGRTGTTGIDEERIVNEVDDVIIHEGGGPTVGMDLQLALAESRKPLADPEMSIGAVEYLLPHFLHGKSVAQLYHWPAQPANEFYSNNRASLAHSWSFPLADVNEVLRVAIDVRRLNKEIAAFVDTPAEVAILYSQTSTLQLPPEMLTWQATPYLAELHKTYEASQYLDAKVTFVTERQAMKGWLDRYKLLLIPGVRNIPAAVVEAIWNYASNGGHVLIVPESLLGDEYNQPQDYLARLGISIRGTRRPKPSGAGRMVQGYDQSFSQDVVFADSAPEKLKDVGTGSIGDLETGGVRQVLAGTGNARILFRYSDASPAVVSVPLGKGVVVYAACSLEGRSYSRLLDALFGEADLQRPLRLRAAVGGGTWKIEARFARAGSRRLLYVVNFNSEPMALRVDTGAEPFEFLRELRDNKVIRGNQITVPGRQSDIYELF
jgi:beta-galactosidase GanA